MFKKKRKILLAILALILGLYSTFSTNWIIDIYKSVWNGSDIDSSSAFFGIANMAGAVFILLYFVLVQSKIIKIIRLFILFVSFILLNGMSIFYIFRYSGEFSKSLTDNYVV